MKLLAVLLYGLSTHGLFVAAVALMAASLHGAMSAGAPSLPPPAAWALNLALALQFPLVHSFFLGRRGRAWLARATPGGLGRDLATTNYALLASLQVGLTFWLWSPTGVTLFHPDARWLPAWTALYGAAWAFLLKAMWDAGIEVQTGSLGWTSVVRGRPVRYRPFPTRGSFARCRQPVYLAFVVILWSGPVWTLDHLVLAVLWTSYCVVGPRFKERRYLERYGGEFAAYQEAVPYLVPLARLRHRRRAPL